MAVRQVLVVGMKMSICNMTSSEFVRRKDFFREDYRGTKQQFHRPLLKLGETNSPTKLCIWGLRVKGAIRYYNWYYLGE
jgi:hypothetical protein